MAKKTSVIHGLNLALVAVDVETRKNGETSYLFSDFLVVSTPSDPKPLSTELEVTVAHLCGDTFEPLGLIEAQNPLHHRVEMICRLSFVLELNGVCVEYPGPGICHEKTDGATVHD